jgi:hypothetical protein
MEVQKETFLALLQEHVSMAGEQSEWVFSFHTALATEEDCSAVLHQFKNLPGFKEQLHIEELIVTPTEGGQSSLYIHGGPSVISNYCMNESAVDAKAAAWRSRLIQASAELPDEFPLVVRSTVIKVTDGHPIDGSAWVNMPKHYRIERVFEYVTKECAYRMKMKRDTDDSFLSMKEANLGGARVTYGVDLHWKDMKAPFESILGHVMRICQIITRNALPISKEQIRGVREAYKKLVVNHVEKARKRFRPKQSHEADASAEAVSDIPFLAPKPITLEQRHLVESSPNSYGGLNILKGYCVTDKADGERMLLYIDDKGDAFFINNDIDIQRAAMSFPKVRNGLLDGEYITVAGGRVIFAAFDIYFLAGEPVYTLPLASKDTKHRTRYKLVQEVCATEKPAPGGSVHELSFKKHYFAEGNDMKAACQQVLYASHDLPYEIDGLIFTPADLGVCGYYPGKDAKFSAFMKWGRVLKWKPPDQNTIDFLIKETRPPIRDRKDGMVYRRFKLYTGYNVTRSTPISVKEGLRLMYDSTYAKDQRTLGDMYVEKEFIPVSYADKDISEVHIPADSQYGRSFQEGMIVEFSYDMNAELEGVPAPRRWIPLRIRDDKTRTYQRTGNISKTANDYTVAASVWRTIHEPVLQEMLTGAVGPAGVANPASLDARILSIDDVYYAREIPRQHMLSVNMFNFHNVSIKGQLYQNHAKRADSLLELACGMAGDMQRWRDGGFRFILGVDLVKDNVCKAGDGAYARALSQRSMIKTQGMERPFNQNIVFVIGDCAKPIRTGECTDDSESKEVLSMLYAPRGRRHENVYRQIFGAAAQRFAVVSCQFAVHYFFQSEVKLDGFLDNVSDNLQKNGIFIATFMDGLDVDRLLMANNGLIEGRKLGGTALVWAIAKRYTSFAASSSADGTDTSDVYGKQVDVYLENTGRLIPEFLVHLPTLIKKLGERDIELVDTHLFSHDFNKILMQRSGPGYNDIKALENDTVQKQFSFLNRWVVFRKK